MDTVVTVLITVLVCALCWYLGLVPQKSGDRASLARPQPQPDRYPDDAPPPYAIVIPKKVPNCPSGPLESTPRDNNTQFPNTNDNIPRESEDDGVAATSHQEQAPQKSLPLSSYTIGWISALPIELAAAKLMLDEVHTHPLDAIPGDTNKYTLGSIHGHNVAIASLPIGSYGTNSAAVVASHVMRTFPKLRFGLMVGIGGGIPSKAHDIRLGDIVVSSPEGRYGGVIQIDLGKDTPEGFELTGMLNRPPSLLLSTIARMKADQVFRQPEDLRILLENIRRKVSRTKAQELTYNPSEDRLYEANYNHPSNMETCERCDDRRLVFRANRDQNDPVIHYGLIASGNRVEKHALNRERLREELNVLCFEMEAAGLMNHFPCIVIRGICDYADSHKNKHYQLYAATVAAAYAKIFLSKISPAAVEQTSLAKEIYEERE